MNQKIDMISVSIAFLAVSLLVSIYLGMMRVDVWLKNSAIDECGSISKYKETFDDKKAIVEYPVTEVYENCLKLKGY